MPEEELPEATPAKEEEEDEEASQQGPSVKTSKKKPQSKKQQDGQYTCLLVTCYSNISSARQSSKILFFTKAVVLSILEADESVDYSLRDALFTACKVGDLGALCSLLQLPQELVDHPERREANSSTAPLSLLNKPIDSSGFTLLHVAAAASQKAVIRLLLDAGADPACRYQ